MTQKENRTGSVIVVAYDSCSPIEYRTIGRMRADGILEIQYPFRNADGTPISGTADDGTQVDLSHIIFPDDHEEKIDPARTVEVGSGGPYRVFLCENAVSLFELLFECSADDAEHAMEQAKDAYPGCKVIACRPFDGSPLRYVAHSPNESATNAGAGFWSNDAGWCEFDDATLFSHSEIQTVQLPLSIGQNARWVNAAEAELHYGGTPPQPLPDDSEIEVSLDGGSSWQPAPQGVRIVYRNAPIDGEDGVGELHFNATTEGLITDVWTTREALDHNIGTSAQLLGDIVTNLVEEGN